MLERELRDESELDLFTTLRAASNQILEVLAADEETILLTRNTGRVDETNKRQLKLRARTLPDTKKDEVLLALDLMDQVVDEIVHRYIDWGLRVGENIARQHGVDHIEARSAVPWAIYKAAFRYEPDKTFPSYASHWIRQTMERSMDLMYVKGKDGEMDEEGEQIKGKGKFVRRTLTTLNDAAGDHDSDLATDHLSNLPDTEDFIQCWENHELDVEVRQFMNDLPVEEQAIMKEWWDGDNQSPAVVERVQKYARQIGRRMSMVG